jgi:hypothetical protein
LLPFNSDLLYRCAADQKIGSSYDQTIKTAHKKGIVKMGLTVFKCPISAIIKPLCAIETAPKSDCQ